MPNTINATKLNSGVEILFQKYLKMLYAISQSNNKQHGVPMLFRGVVDSAPYVFEKTKRINGEETKSPVCSVKLTTFQACLAEEHKNKQFKKQPVVTVIFQNKAYATAVNFKVGDVVDIICQTTERYNDRKESFYTEFVCGHELTVETTIPNYVDSKTRAPELKRMYAESQQAAAKVRTPVKSKIEILEEDTDNWMTEAFL